MNVNRAEHGPVNVEVCCSQMKDKAIFTELIYGQHGVTLKRERSETKTRPSVLQLGDLIQTTDPDDRRTRTQGLFITLTNEVQHAAPVLPRLTRRYRGRSKKSSQGNCSGLAVKTHQSDSWSRFLLSVRLLPMQ